MPTEARRGGQFLRAVRFDPPPLPPGDEPRFPFTVPAVRALGEAGRLDLHPAVTFLVGENGSGKSTVLEAIADHEGLRHEGGSRNMADPRKPHETALGQTLTFERGRGHDGNSDAFFLRAESFYNVATLIDDLGVAHNYGGSLHAKSHGESFLALLEHRFRGNGLYLMDEPESALSPQRQLAFLALLDDYVRDGSQFVIATHSPILMAYPHAAILQFDDGGVRPVRYEETEHYRVTKAFLDCPARMLRELIGGI